MHGLAPHCSSEDKSLILLVRVLSLLGVSALLASQAHAVSVPRPEHPFPQMQRAQWTNLNGAWEFAESDQPNDAVYLSDKPYPDKIIVPYCRESKLSGLGRKGFVNNVWYRRTFDLPKNWRSPRTLLHIGACDYKTRVWLNGSLLGEHAGGSAPISFEVSRHLKPSRNVVIVGAYDDVRTGLQAGGKQSPQLESFGCLYTRTTGIWQTVWLEGVGGSYLRDVRVEPDPAGSRVLLQAEIDGPNQGVQLVITARAGGKIVGQATVPANWRDAHAVLNLSKKRLWSIGDPFLYDLHLSLVKAGKVIDSVDSYFGLRNVSIRGAAILINGKPVFQRLVLDQGFYPDGIWTAPTDAELRKDVERSKLLGFNGARLHQKVFEPRFLYWADKLGYLVWGEFPNWGLGYSNPAINLPVLNEWGEILRRDRNHPSIIGWCPLNETNAEAAELQNTIVRLTWLIDPSRPVIDTSGYIHSIPNPDVLDAHDYDQSPASLRMRWCDSFGLGSDLPSRYGGSLSYAGVPFMVSEYGGMQLAKSGGWGYGAAPKDLEEFYTRYAGLTDALLDSRYMFGFCYTQLTDVEQERNGMYTYDRKLKFDAARIRKINARQAECERNPAFTVPMPVSRVWKVLVGAVPDKELAREWKYVTQTPDSEWTQLSYDDGSWKSGLAGFGAKGGWDWAIRTPWTTNDIWLRQEFTYDGTPIDRALLVTHYDNGTEVYLNGVRIWAGQAWNGGYDGFAVTDGVKKSIKTGPNMIAIHCHQDGGGQFIDAALLVAK